MAEDSAKKIKKELFMGFRKKRGIVTAVVNTFF